MSSFLNKLGQMIAPIIGIAVFCILFIVGIVVFSYVLVFIAILGFIIFCVAFVRAKILQRKMKNQPKQHSQSQGRVIDYDDIEK